MLRVGLTGGLASGKSFVGRALCEMGCLLIEADLLGHQVMAKSAEAYDAIVAEFGSAILNPQSEIDRRKLAAIVFQDPQRLAQLKKEISPFKVDRLKRHEFIHRLKFEAVIALGRRSKTSTSR